MNRTIPKRLEELIHLNMENDLNPFKSDNKEVYDKGVVKEKGEENSEVNEHTFQKTMRGCIGTLTSTKISKVIDKKVFLVNITRWKFKRLQTTKVQ